MIQLGLFAEICFRMLDEILAEIEKHQQPKVFETDGEVMFRHRRFNLNK